MFHLIPPLYGEGLLGLPKTSVADASSCPYLRREERLHLTLMLVALTAAPTRHSLRLAQRIKYFWRLTLLRTAVRMLSRSYRG
jgi:hypothetical protein